MLQGDLAAQMVAGIDRHLTHAIAAATDARGGRWQRDLASHERYLASVAPNRERLRRILGAVDPRVASDGLEFVATTTRPALLGGGAGYKAYAVRWAALAGVDGEGLLLVPDEPAKVDVIALADCDITPEKSAGLEPGAPPEAQFPRRLAERGCRVLVPFLIDRGDTHSGDPSIRMTNQPHREYVYRGAFEMGRHIIGYELQKVFAAIDALARDAGDPPRPVGVIGHGEGGLLALYSAALDPRIAVAAVCGYFGPRESLWREPIYRNVWNLLAEFGDAEIATLIAPRPLLIEACRAPEIKGPPPRREGRSGAAPGALTTPPLAAVRAEVERARSLLAGLAPPATIELVVSGEGDGAPGSDGVIEGMMRSLTPPPDPLPEAERGSQVRPLSIPPSPLRGGGQGGGVNPRLPRQLAQLVEFTQSLMRDSGTRRAEFWRDADATSVATWEKSARRYRDLLWDEVIGRLPPPSLPPNARSRRVTETAAFTGYEVMLDVWDDVFAYGILLLPNDLRPGERRPVVVCQHGLEGRPQDLADPRIENPAYNQYACRLAERGFITYAPQNPYIGEDRFRVLQRKANPLGASLFSFIVRQHEQTLNWLESLPFVDPERIAFYGLSYGGKTAMRVPALLERYCLSICSADYNEWIWKNVSSRSPYSYLFTGEYEMFEFDLGHTFNYAEMSWLICPRPFMVERGHHDGVAPDEWVAYEYARTYRRYALLGLAGRTEIEFFDGPHTIHGMGTFAFLHRHLRWPE
jgi:dienelactone hydrolase